MQSGYWHWYSQGTEHFHPTRIPLVTVLQTHLPSYHCLFALFASYSSVWAGLRLWVVIYVAHSPLVGQMEPMFHWDVWTSLSFHVVWEPVLLHVVWSLHMLQNPEKVCFCLPTYLNGSHLFPPALCPKWGDAHGPSLLGGDLFSWSPYNLSSLTGLR